MIVEFYKIGSEYFWSEHIFLKPCRPKFRSKIQQNLQQQRRKEKKSLRLQPEPLENDTYRLTSCFMSRMRASRGQHFLLLYPTMFSLFGSGCSVRYRWISSRASSAVNLFIKPSELSSAYHNFKLQNKHLLLRFYSTSDIWKPFSESFKIYLQESWAILV